MSQLTDNLYTIDAIKSGIRSAIEEKGVDMTGLSFPDYPGAISQISTGGTFVTETLSVSINGTYTPSVGIDGYSQVTVNVPQSVTGYTEKEITEGVNIVSLNNSASYVKANVFADNYALTTVNLPICKEIRSSAFKGCNNLSSLNIPLCEKIGYSAFADCNLSLLSLPICKSIEPWGFYANYSLKEINLPECTYFGDLAFKDCSSLSQVSIPKCRGLEYGVFEYCGSLKQVYLPECIHIGYGAFTFCSSLSQVSLPMCFSIDYAAFQYCYSLSQLSIPMCTIIQGQAFVNCTSLSELTVGTGLYNITRLDSNDAFVETPFNSGIGSIYVNSIYYDKYIVADNWSNYSSLIVSINVPGGDSLLSFSNGIVSGTTTYIMSDIYDVLSIDKSQVLSVSLPNCKYVYQEAFSYCFSLTTIDLPECTYIDSSAFSECHYLSNINLPKCEYIGKDAFVGFGQSVASPFSISLPVCSYIDDLAFYWTPKLAGLTLGYSSVCKVGQDPLANTYASIYVPASLVDAYKADQYWSWFESRIFPIE